MDQHVCIGGIFFSFAIKLHHRDCDLCSGPQSQETVLPCVSKLMPVYLYIWMTFKLIIRLLIHGESYLQLRYQIHKYKPNHFTKKDPLKRRTHQWLANKEICTPGDILTKTCWSQFWIHKRETINLLSHHKVGLWYLERPFTQQIMLPNFGKRTETGRC